MTDIKALNYEQLIMEAKLKKKGKRNPDYFSAAVKSEIEELITLPYHYKDTHSMQKLILHLNVRHLLTLAQKLPEIQR